MDHEIRHFHLFAGLGGGARGFNQGEARVGQLRARFRCLGGVDVDPATMRDFERLAGVRGTVADLFDHEQYRNFHGHEPPPGWREATPQDLQRAAGNERPDIVFASPPCKGLSGLLSEAKSQTAKYQALNRLTVRGIWLALEAWRADPVPLYLIENVPRILTRGRDLLDRIGAMLRAYGYVVNETVHDCGELGGLAQSRKRFLLVARHAEKVPAMLYQPPRRALRGVGEVLSYLPVPSSQVNHPMHRVPCLSWKTWVRLAFVESGSDWRSLNKLAVTDGRLRDFVIVPEMYGGALGATDCFASAGTVTGSARSVTGAFNVADPRFVQSARWSEGRAYGVRRWSDHSGTVTCQQSPGQGAFALADPRCATIRHSNVFRIVRWMDPSRTVTGAMHAASGGGVADPRIRDAVLASHGVDDPRCCLPERRSAYQSAGHYGVVPWSAATGAVSAAARHDNGRFNVADPRLPQADQRLVAVIRALDGTWHRPFTTLELAALQSLFDPEDPQQRAAFALDGASDSDWRERIGNAVPCAAARAIASVMGQTILLARSGETFSLHAFPVWVRPVLTGLSIDSGAVP